MAEINPTSPLMNLRMEIDRKVAEKLPFVVLEEEKRLHGRRHAIKCYCQYCKFLPSYVRAKVRYLYRVKKYNKFFIDEEEIRLYKLYQHLKKEKKVRQELLDGE